MKKINFLILANDSIFARVMCKNIVKDTRFNCIAIFLSQKNRTLKSMFNNLKKTSIKYFFYRLFIQLIFNTFGLNLKNFLKMSKCIAGQSLEVIEKDIDRSDFVMLINFDIKVNHVLLKKYKRKFINAHASFLPEYSGISPYFWQWMDERKVIGITYYFLDEQFDTGEIIYVSEFNINNFTSLFNLHYQLMNTISKEWPVVLALAQKLINSNSSNKRIKFIKEMYRSFPDKEMVNKMKFSKKIFFNFKSLLKVIYNEKYKN